jgi:anti-sigma-K factor RskA
MDAEKRPQDVLAAEYALGLLEGEELLMMRGRIAREPELAEAVARWEGHFAPLSDELAGVKPPPHVWAQIEAEVEAEIAQRQAAGSGTADVSGQIISLEARLRRWKMIGSASAAAAVAALCLLIFAPSVIGPGVIGPDIPGSSTSGPITNGPERTAAAPLVASIPIGDTPLRLGVTYLPDQSELLVSASGLSADGVHDHELWLVPADAQLPAQSLGVVDAGSTRRVQLAPAVAQMMADGSDLVLTREPLGGKPQGIDAGPVVAEGQLQAI